MTDRTQTGVFDHKAKVAVASHGGGAQDSADGGADGPAESSDSSATSSTGNEPIRALESYRHLGHYIVNLLQSLQGSRVPSAVHPLSVSSSGESDDEDNGASTGKEKPTTIEGSPVKLLSSGQKDALVQRVVDCLDNEDEDGVKNLLKPYMGDMGSVRDIDGHH